MAGALTGVVEATIAAMERLGARRDRLQAAIGPRIGRLLRGWPRFPAPFPGQGSSRTRLLPHARAGHFLFMPAGYLCVASGLPAWLPPATGHDTLAAGDDFFSYRRNTLQGSATTAGSVGHRPATVTCLI